jgi:hypothetical protein
MPVSSPNALTYRSPRGSVLFQPVGMQAFGFGDVDMTRTNDLTRDPIYSNEYAVKTLVSNEVDQQLYTLNLTCRNVTDYLEMIEFLSNKVNLTQVAATDLTVVVENPVAGQAIILGKRKIVAGSVTISDGAAGDTYDEGIDFVVDYDGGFVTLINLLGANPPASLTVTFDCAAAKGKGYNLGSLSEIRGRLIFIEAVKPGRTPSYHEYYDVGFAPDGDVTMISSDSTRSVQIKGTVYAVPNKPVGENLGFVDGSYI